MSNECDLCGQENAECHCYLYEIEERVAFLEDELEKLTSVVKHISNFLSKGEYER